MKKLFIACFIFCCCHNITFAQPLSDTTLIFGDFCFGDSFLFDTILLSDAGVYVFNYQNQNGGDSTVLLTLTILPVDTVEMIIELCQGDTSLLTGIIYPNPADFTEEIILQNQYGCDSVIIGLVVVHPEEWGEGWAEVPFGEIINGIPITEPTWMANYDTTEHGCLLTIAIIYIPIMSAVNEFEKVASLLVLPNPISDYLQVQFNLKQKMDLEIELYDALGQRVATLLEYTMLAAGDHSLQYDGRGLENGVYWITFISSEGKTSRKVIKK